jgi:hypothetical protein
MVGRGKNCLYLIYLNLIIKLLKFLMMLSWHRSHTLTEKFFSAVDESSLTSHSTSSK